jgi:cytoskeletal protein CcmA (bactofilin family)
MGIFGGKPPESKPGGPSARQPLAKSSAPDPAALQRQRSTCVIGSKTTLNGTVSGDEDVLVEGLVEGEVKISSSLTIGAGGKVNASVEARSVVVSGELNGNCSVSERVEIQSTGRMTGDIRAPKIVIAEGAVFRGNSDMSPRDAKRGPGAAVS